MDTLNTQIERESTPSVIQSPLPRPHSGKSFFAYVVIALGIALFTRFFIAAPYVVSGASMEPTFDNWHYVIVDRISYRLATPKRGDVIIFDAPREHGRALIKRIIGLPGETIILRDNSVTIVNDSNPDGFTLSEPYLSEENLGGKSNMETTLGANEYFVLGDNRRMSSDSRSWGTLPREFIVGRALIRLYPFTMVDILPGIFRY